MNRRSCARPARALVALAAGVAAVALLCGLRTPVAKGARGAFRSGGSARAEVPAFRRGEVDGLAAAARKTESARRGDAVAILAPCAAIPIPHAGSPAGAPRPGPADEFQALLAALRTARARGDRLLARHLEDRLAAKWSEDDFRAAWLRALVEERDPDRAEMLLDLLESCRAAAAAGETVADARAIGEVNAALRYLLEGGAPSRVRQRAISLHRWSAEIDADAEWTAALSRVALADPDPEVQARAIRVLAARVPGEPVTESIAALASGHPDPALRAAAAAALAHRILPRSCPEATLAALAEDPAPVVRHAAGEALESALLRPAREDVGRIPPEVAREVVAALGDRLEGEPDAGVRCVLVRTLFVAGGEAALPWLEAHAEEGDSDPGLHRALRAALASSLASITEVSGRRTALEEVAPELFAGGR